MSTPLQYLNPPPLPPLQGNGDDQSINPFIFNPLFQGTSSSSPPVEQERKDHGRDQQQEGEYQEADKGFSPSGSREDHFLLQTASIRDSIDTKSSSGVKSLCYEGERDGEKCENASAAKWMSSKMRLMRKMLNSDLNDAKKAGCRREETTLQTWQRSAASDEDNSNNSGSNKIRVCSDCNTTKTPLWRTGPQGPKSLCNACGIRQRKARRAMAAAAAAATASGGLLSVDASRTSGSSKAIKHKRSSSGYTTQYKKKCKFGGIPSKEKIQFDEFDMRVNQNSTFHRVFPQDEKEAAMLLMALSYGLVRG